MACAPQTHLASQRMPPPASRCSPVSRNIPKSTLSQHFKALREAGLVRSERHGVEMRNSSRCKEIEQRFPGLLVAILNAHKVQATTGRNRGAKRKQAARKKAG